jgi:hypothetical protein
MRPLLIGLGLGLLASILPACGDEEEVACDCAEVGCFADMCTKTVFVTRNAIPSNFGGIAAADALCAQEAAAAGLPGTYYAWLSDKTSSPFTRFSRPTVPYTLPDGAEIAANYDALAVAVPPIAQHADATPVPADDPDDDPQQVWTGTTIDGHPDTNNNASNYCSDWTSNVITNFTLVGWIHSRVKPKFDWTRANLVPCTGVGYLYCFQQ